MICNKMIVIFLNDCYVTKFGYNLSMQPQITGAKVENKMPSSVCFFSGKTLNFCSSSEDADKHNFLQFFNRNLKSKQIRFPRLKETILLPGNL